MQVALCHSIGAELIKDPPKAGVRELPAMISWRYGCDTHSGGNHYSVLGTNRMVWFTLHSLRGIGAVQKKESCLGEFIPQLLQTNGGFDLFLLPQYCNHFPENHDAPVPGVGSIFCSADNVAKFVQKLLPVRRSAIHK